ncbi:MAG: ATP-binding protein [Actinomycetota bacterium]
MKQPASDEPRSHAITARGALVAILAPAIASIVSVPLSTSGPASAIAVFLLACVIAAVAGGLWSGLLAAAISSFALPFLFGTERFSLKLDGAEDVVAAVVFLAVAMVVGLLVGGATEDRARAARREREARLLGYLSSKLLTGEVPDRVLDDVANILLDPFGLVSCDILVELDGQPLHAHAERPGAEPGGPKTLVPLVVGAVSFGTLEAERPMGRRPLTKDEELLLEAAAKQAAGALDRARLDARVRLAQLDAETNQLRAAMFSSVTHDLRTPLASIKAGVTSLLDPSVNYEPEQERELLTTILEETDRLNRLVGNILDLAKIRAGALIPTRHAAAIDEIVGVVLSRMRPRMQAQGIRVESRLRPDLPDVMVDEMQLDQVLTNLLENAARYSPPDAEIVISAAIVNDAVQMRVSDRGPGIPPEERERVFEAFYRGDRSPEMPGSGLGLAIVKAIVTAHGGRIWVEGAPGGGTAVVFQIPVGEGAN